MTYTNKSGTIDEVQFCQCKFPIKLWKGEGSFKGVKMMWSVFNFKSPLGSLTEEYGTHISFTRSSVLLAHQIANWRVTCAVRRKENESVVLWKKGYENENGSEISAKVSSIWYYRKDIKYFCCQSYFLVWTFNCRLKFLYDYNIVVMC